MKRRNFLQTPLALSVAQLAAQLAPANASRLRLFFTSERIASLRGRLTRDASLQARWAKLLRRADELVEARLFTQKEADSVVSPNAEYPAVSSQVRNIGMTLGLAWRMTGEERYARKLREALLNSTGFERWISQNWLQRTPPWRAGLWTSALTVGCAVGYDALLEFLSAAERRSIAEGMLRLGVLPLLEDWVLAERRIHALDSMGHNYFPICSAGAGVGALALLGEDPRAPGWLQAVETTLEAWFDYQGQVLQHKTVNFDAAGAYYEGLHYAIFSVSEYLLFRLARVNAIPAPKPARIPAVERVAEFFVQTYYPTAKSLLAVNFGDDFPPSSAARAMQLLAPQGFSPELARWYIERVAPESSDPLALVYHDQAAGAARNTLPLSVIYRDIGWAVLRNSWENDATMLAIKSGFTWNHAHADAGSFILFHAGQPLLIDSGTCAYSRPEYTNYYRQSRAHNVVLFNGEGQPVEDFQQRGVKFPGRVHSLLDGAGLKYIYADATGPMARHLTRNYRHWLWLDGVILIFDDLLAHEPGRFDWLLHYAGEARRNGTEVEVTNGQAKANVKMLFPADPAIREEEGLAHNQPDVKVTYLAFATADTAREQKFIVAVAPQPAAAADPVPKLELLRGEDLLGVRVRSEREITDVYLNLRADGRRMHLNSNHTIEGWETDAYLLALTRPAGSATSTPENVTRYFVSAASYLRREGQVILHAVSKASAIIQPGAKMEVLIEGQKRIDATLFSPQKPATLLVNGQPAPFDHQPGQNTIRFRHDTL